MKITLPETITVERPTDGEIASVPSAYSGHIVVPDTWTGADFQAHYEAGRRDDDEPHPWQRQYRWAKARVVEWAIDGLPTNPNQIEDDALPLAFQRWLYRAVAGAMNDYGNANAAIQESLAFPTAANLTGREFFAWYQVWDNLDENPKRAGLLRAWEHSRLLVREWGDVGEPRDASGLTVDLALLVAVTGVTAELISDAMNLGNWLAPRGKR